MSAKAQFPDEQSADGNFQSQDDAFRGWIQNNKDAQFPLAKGRYHLYASLACPWAHRTLIVRSLLGLEDAVSVSIVDPLRDELGWAFRDVPGATPDQINHFKYLSEAYSKTDSSYEGRVTVPVLWDIESKRIVSNSDDDIMRMLETVFLPLAKSPIDLVSKDLLLQIDALNEQIYHFLNNGVYKAGFATDQAAYEMAVAGVFEMLDRLEKRLKDKQFLFGDTLTETDWRLFVTLIRFDAVYVGHFKCNIRRIVDYPNLWSYLRKLYHTGSIAETVNFAHIKHHYYQTHDEINPTRIVPVGPTLIF